MKRVEKRRREVEGTGNAYTDKSRDLMNEPLISKAEGPEVKNFLNKKDWKKMDPNISSPMMQGSVSTVDTMLGLENTDADLGDNPFGLDLDEPLPQEGGRKSRRNKRSNKSKTNKRKSHKRKTNKSKSHKKMGGKKNRRNKKGSRRNRK